MAKEAFIALAVLMQSTVMQSEPHHQFVSARFDLVCDVHRHWRYVNGLEGDGHSDRYILHVDLENMRWCEDVCDKAYKIVSLDHENFTFAKSKSDSFMIARDGGHLYRRQHVTSVLPANYMQTTSGSCRIGDYWSSDVK